MISVRWSLVETTAQLLEGDQREAVLGDLLEAGDSASQSLLGIVGLVVRSHVAVWRSWRPWLAAFGLSLPASFLLMGVSLSVSQAWQRPGMATLLSQVLLLIGWSWTGGYVVGMLSRRTLWLSAVLCCSPCLFCLARFRMHSGSRFCLLLFLLPATWGVCQGLRRIRLSVRSINVLALILTLLMIASHRSWILGVTLTWPAWYLVAVARENVTT